MNADTLAIYHNVFIVSISVNCVCKQHSFGWNQSLDCKCSVSGYWRHDDVGIYTASVVKRKPTIPTIYHGCTCVKTSASISCFWSAVSGNKRSGSHPRYWRVKQMYLGHITDSDSSPPNRLNGHNGRRFLVRVQIWDIKPLHMDTIPLYQVCSIKTLTVVTDPGPRVGIRTPFHFWDDVFW